MVVVLEMDDMLRLMSAHVVVRPSSHEFVDGADTILDVALRSGLALNYGCSNGNCGLCKARVVSGQVQKVRLSPPPRWSCSSGVSRRRN